MKSLTLTLVVSGCYAALVALRGCFTPPSALPSPPALYSGGQLEAGRPKVGWWSKGWGWGLDPGLAEPQDLDFEPPHSRPREI